MSNRKVIITKLRSALSNYLTLQYNLPEVLNEIMFLELEQNIDNLNGEYFLKNTKDKIWEELVLDRFSYSDIKWYLDDEKNSEIVEYLIKTMSCEDWKTCFEKFGTNPSLSDIIECSLMRIFDEIFDLLYPIIIENLQDTIKR